MAISRGPKIVTNGLLMLFDAADRNSYPGSGTTWYDLSGNRNHVTMNGSTNPVFSANNGGRFFFNGTTSKSYFQSSTYNGLTNILNCTILIWASWVPSTTNRYYIFDSRVSTPSYGAGLGFDKVNSTTARPFHFFNDTAGYDEANSPATFNQNQIYLLGIKRISNSIQTIDTTSNTWISPTLNSDSLGRNAIAQLGNFRIGSYSGSDLTTTEYWWSGYIYSVMMYNRDLSQAELTQNYNAAKARYGL